MRRGGPSEIGFSGYRAIEQFDRAGFEMVPVEPNHAAAVETLARIHGDPFDRLLIAQAQPLGLQLVTHDHALARYGDFVRVV